MNVIDPVSFRAFNALDVQARKRRPDGRVLDHGEAVHFDIMLRDAATAVESRFLTDAPKGSLKATVQSAIEAAAKKAGMKPADWLAQQSAADLRWLNEASLDTLTAAMSGGDGLDRLLEDRAIRERADFSRSLAAARFADGAKLVDMPEGSTRAIGGTVSADPSTHDAAPAARVSIDALRAARYQG